MGNVYAQVSAVQTGVKRYLTLIEKYGVETFDYCVNEIIAHGETVARRALRGLPRGTWRAEDFLDNNVISDKPIKMKVRVSITENSFLVDYTGSDEQVEGTVNCPLGISISAANSTFKSITTPNEPTNAGHFVPVHVTAPEGTIFNPVPPAGVKRRGGRRGSRRPRRRRPWRPCLRAAPHRGRGRRRRWRPGPARRGCRARRARRRGRRRPGPGGA